MNSVVPCGARLILDDGPVADEDAGPPNESPCARVARRGHGRVVDGVWVLNLCARGATGARARVVAGITAGARAPRPVGEWMNEVCVV